MELELLQTKSPEIIDWDNETFQYQDVTFKKKEYKSFKPFQLGANILMDRYKDTELKYVATIMKDIMSLMVNKNFYAELTADDVKGKRKKLNKRIIEFVNKYPEYSLYLQRMSEKRQIAIEAFVLNSDNAKELLELLFDDAGTINHEPTPEDSKAYTEFMTKCFNFFLASCKKYLPSVKSILG